MTTMRSTVTTDSSISARDVTELVAELIDGATGAFLVSVPHTTCALILSEVDDELLADYERLAAELLAPFEPFTHIRNNVPNASAHMLSALFGTSLTLVAHSGTIELGRYQRVVLIELDGPKERTIEARALSARDAREPA